MEGLGQQCRGGARGGGPVRAPTTNKEVFDAEVFAVLQAVKLLSERNEGGQDYMVFSDSQAAVARIQHSGCGPAQALARAAIESYELRQRGNSVTVQWTPAHAGVEGNEHAGARAKRAAEGENVTPLVQCNHERSLDEATPSNKR